MTGNLGVYEYAIPLRKAVLIGGHRKEHSRGFLVHHAAGGGAASWADIAPLDGYSNETFDEVRSGLLSMQPTLEALGKLGQRFASVGWAASVLRGDETAAVRHAGSLPLARLVTPGETDAMLMEIAGAVDEGFRTIKLKLGGRPVERDIDLVQRAARITAEGLSLRLDANRQWTIDEAVTFARATEGVNVEFVEEPLRDGRDYDVLERSTSLPLALDESLAIQPAWLNRSWSHLKAAVIKPMLLGDRTAILKIAAWARARGACAVVSSMYESGIGIRSLLGLAAEIAPGVTAGLDTYGLLADDIATPSLAVADGAMDPRQVDPSTWRVELTKLNKVL